MSSVSWPQGMVQKFPVGPFFFVAPEDRGGQQQDGPASIWQLAEVMAIVTAHSRASYGPPILHVRSLSSAFSLFSAQAWFEAGHSWNSEATSCSIQARSVTTVPVASLTEDFVALITEDGSQRK